MVREHVSPPAFLLHGQLMKEAVYAIDCPMCGGDIAVDDTENDA